MSDNVRRAIGLAIIWLLDHEREAGNDALSREIITQGIDNPVDKLQRVLFRDLPGLQQHSVFTRIKSVAQQRDWSNSSVELRL